MTPFLLPHHIKLFLAHVACIEHDCKKKSKEFARYLLFAYTKFSKYSI